jgi:hypothetical protein
LDDNPPEASIDPETALLLANIDSARRSLEKADAADDAQTSLSCLEAALHTYGSIKHLLPKLSLNAAQRVPVEEELRKLRDQILAHNLYPGA